eukprot:GDKI01027968.1.p2 GENE.GDKI01027968.1~~GDKI01027968.1.p2  ORF type:complete len:113 (-),score=44.54 GDKI01027968.1:476-814(-)
MRLSFTCAFMMKGYVARAMQQLKRAVVCVASVSVGDKKCCEKTDEKHCHEHTLNEIWSSLNTKTQRHNVHTRTHTRARAHVRRFRVVCVCACVCRGWCVCVRMWYGRDFVCV